MLTLQASALGAKLHHTEAGGVVDKDLGGEQTARGINQTLELLVFEPTRACRLRINTALHHQETLHQRLVRHLQTEDGHIGLQVFIHMESCISCCCEYERCLSHRRTCGDNHQIPGLESGSELVDIQRSEEHTAELQSRGHL